MNIAPERAREACDNCRKSHKRCIYDTNSTRCDRCAKREVSCSLFPETGSVDAAQQGPPALIATVPAPGPQWDVTPNDSAVSPSFPYPPFLPQEYYPFPNAVSAETTQGGYSANMIFRSSNNPLETAPPAMNQDGSYGNNGVFQ